MMLSREEKMNIKKTPFFGGKEERLSNLLPKSIQSIHEDLKNMRREMCIESPREFGSESKSRFSYDECEHAAHTMMHSAVTCPDLP